MKLYLLLLISSLITIIKSAQKQFCDCSPKVEKPSDCNDTFIKASEYDDCCYLEGKWKGKQTKTCIDLTPIRKDELESYIKELNEDADTNIEKIICNSFNINISVIFFLLLFFY